MGMNTTKVPKFVYVLFDKRTKAGVKTGSRTNEFYMSQRSALIGLRNMAHYYDVTHIEIRKYKLTEVEEERIDV